MCILINVYYFFPLGQRS